MEPDVDSLILLFDRLGDDQKNEAIDRLNEYIRGGLIVKQRIVKESGQRNVIKRMDVGPTSSGACVCCGK